MSGYNFYDACALAIEQKQQLTYGTATNLWYPIGPEDRDFDTAFSILPNHAARLGELLTKRKINGARHV